MHHLNISQLQLNNMAEVYVCESRSRGKTVNDRLGKGLHALGKLKKGSMVGQFVGDVITVEEFKIRDAAGRGGYGIYLREGMVLDCYDAYIRGECLMSYCNTARSSYTYKQVRGCAVGIESMVPNRNNCYARVDGDKARLWVGDRDILEGRELFWAYGPKYSL
jgi:hypothetical protein